MSNSNFVPDIEKPGSKFGYQKDIIDIIVNVHFILYTSESMCCRAITFTFFNFAILAMGGTVWAQRH